MNELDLEKFKKCPSCNIDVENELVRVDYKFSLWGWFMWSMGTTAVPKNVSFTCKTCNIKFDSINETELIKHFTKYRRK